jgi:hypothetical protein
MSEPSILDVRLAEIDRRLEIIQSGLAPPTDPATAPAPPPEASPPAHAPAPPSVEAPPPPQFARRPTAPAAPVTHFAPPPRLRAAPPAPTAPPTPAAPPAPTAPPTPAAPPPETSELIAQLRELTEAHERLLTATRELLASYAGALSRVPAGSEPSAAAPTAPAPTAPAPTAPSAPTAPTARSEVSVSAGPFASTAALRGFERALGQLPEVREVAVRAYEGDDRAVVDVLLVQPTS